jgi:alginate O-acetyltransferase complex protein AlgI
MLFNSIEFAIFLAIVLLLYWTLFNRNLKIQNAFILLVSYVFYGWWNLEFLILIGFTSICSYYSGILIEKLRHKYNNRNDSKILKTKLKLVTGTNIVLNIGILGYFKYFNFFIDSFIDVFRLFNINVNVKLMSIILPVGISFYTFQALSYTIDVFRKEIEPTKDIISFLSFVAFFPQLVAGPIERASHLLPQFSKRRKFDYEITVDGLRLIIWGLFKKIVIADRLAILVNAVYDIPEDYGGISLIIATIFFSVQIYCDFSGYSDIAIGVAKLFGINLRINFNLPYLSKSIAEFWKRWHISLSTWFRDYVYIPLGGNKVSKTRNVMNLFIVFTISGFWHGANYTFIIWGAIHGLLLVINKLTFKKENRKRDDQALSLFNIFRMLTTYLTVTFAWIFFRANNLTDAVYVVKNIFNFNYDDLSIFYKGGATASLFGMSTLDFYFSIFFIIILLLIEIKSRHTDVVTKLKSYSVVTRWLFYISFTIVILWFGKFGSNQFIYFQF